MINLAEKIRKDILIRMLYLFPLIMFVVGLIKSLKELDFESSLGIEYKYVFVIPIIIFTYQTIRNSKLGWTLVMILYVTYLSIWTYRLIGAFSLVDMKYTIGQYISFWFFLLIYIGIGLIYYKFRPKEMII